MSSEKILEENINIIGENTEFKGSLVLRDRTRFHGRLEGELLASDHSTVILSESSTIEGTVRGDSLFVDGYIKGDVYAKTIVRVSGTGKVIGNIYAPTVKIEFGARFDGQCKMEKTDFKSSPLPSPV